MEKKRTTRAPAAEPAAQHTLGNYLANIRAVRKLKLREVEAATGNEVSNAYLSQLETNKIHKPSPHVLHALAKVYSVPYETLMEKAGYLPPATTAPSPVLRSSGGARHGRAATFANENLTKEEEDSLLQYLAFLRSRRGKGGKT